MIYKPYTGVGSRSTPPDICARMTKLASCLNTWTLRSGGADGADQAFENGALNKEIFLPWECFNKNKSQLFTQPPEAQIIAEKHHPNWKNLTEPVRALMSRNVQQVLGENLDSPSIFLVCWTPNGEEVGGTRLAISVAKENKIPVFNLALDCAGDLWRFVKEYETRN